MKQIYVTAQNSVTREWIPVAELSEESGVYRLRYTQGAARLPGFSGLGRMQALDESYYSPVIFPFFANRLLPRSRPEYRDYLRWVGLDSHPSNPMELLAITGGARATDGYQLVVRPKTEGNRLKLEFFARGIRHLPVEVTKLLFLQEVGAQVLLMKDIQNDKDSLALAIRTAEPASLFIGYVPRYYCFGITRLIDIAPDKVNVRIKRLNKDAPFDMQLLLSIEAECPNNFDLMEDVNDFHPFTIKESERLSGNVLLNTRLDLHSN